MLVRFIEYRQYWLEKMEKMEEEKMSKQAVRYRAKGRRDLDRPCKKVEFIDTGKGHWPNP
jgi:hypothetical protein